MERLEEVTEEYASQLKPGTELFLDPKNMGTGPGKENLEHPLVLIRLESESILKDYMGMDAIRDYLCQFVDAEIEGKKPPKSDKFPVRITVNAITFNTEPGRYIGIHLNEIKGPEKGFYYDLFHRKVD